MKIFFDTEFQERDYRCLDFISLGMVREDGQELYGIAHELSWSQHPYSNAMRLVIHQTPCSDWINENVLKHLDLKNDHKINLHEIVEFCGDSPEFWADYGACDWVTICQLFGTMMDLPKGWPMFVRDFQQYLDDACIFEDISEEPHDPVFDRADARTVLAEEGPQQDPATLHHALHDARHLKAQYDFIQSRL